MAIKSIEVKNLLVFGQHDNSTFQLDFCDGINVIIGENGVGKTTLLKMLYAAMQWSESKMNPLKHFFSISENGNSVLKNADNLMEPGGFSVTDGEHSVTCSVSEVEVSESVGWDKLDIQSVFIPSTEMLSHSKGFLALNQKYHMPFDGTQVDIIVNASLPETREVPTAMERILNKISDVIGGTVIQEEDTFYVIKKDGYKVEFSLEAEGLRKLGLLWKLIRNGLLENGSVLLWDEPEANLNPELYPLVAEILLELEKNGVQIFVATHSYNFAKYLEIRREKKEQVMFHNLYKMSSESGVILSNSAFRMEDVSPNHIMIADMNLLDEVYEQ